MDNFLSVRNNMDDTDALIFIHNINLRGGTEIMALNLMSAMNSAGIKCKILTLVPYSGKDHNILSVPSDAFKLYQSTSDSFINKFIRPTKYLKILRHILEQAVLIISPKLFINFTYDFFPATPNGNSKTLTCGVLHWSIIGYEQSIFSQIKLKPLIQRPISYISFLLKMKSIHRCLPHINKLIALTHAGKKEILNINHKISKEQIEIIPNFIPFGKPCQYISSLCNKTAIFVGRLSIEKGCYRLLDIWEIISHKNPDWHLKIYGTGNEYSGMLSEIKRRNIPNIQFCGFEKDLDEIYKNADILLCTSDSEGFGLVLIEAMYYGVIPISFDCPISPKEIIGEAGILVDCYNYEQYAREINELIASPYKMRQLQFNAINRAAEFLEPIIISKWKKITDRNTIL